MRAPIPNIWSWPLDGISDGRFSFHVDDRSIRDVIVNILLTRPGERIQRPDFGAGLLDFVHQPNNETTRSLIASVVAKAIERWEPRVILDGVDVTSDEVRVAEAQVHIRYRMRFSNLPASLDLTLRLGAGT